MSNNASNGFLKNNAMTIVLAVLLVAGIALIAWSFLSPSLAKTGDNKKQNDTSAVSDEYISKLESRASSLISSIDGVSDVKIVLTLESGAQMSYSSNTLTSSTAPKVRGVAVVCRGGDSPIIQAKITELLCALFDLSSNHIYVSG